MSEKVIFSDGMVKLSGIKYPKLFMVVTITIVLLIICFCIKEGVAAHEIHSSFTHIYIFTTSI